MFLKINSIGSGEPLVFLHGFGFNSQCFKSLAIKLSSFYRCILIDLPGFGQTPYEPYDLNSLLIALKKNLPLNINLLGWSLGGNIALAYADKYPLSVQKLILVASNPMFIEKFNWPGMEYYKFNSFFNLCENDFLKASKTFKALQFPIKKVDKKIFLKLDELSKNEFLNKDAACNALLFLKKFDLRKAFFDLNMPSLSLFGKYDQLVPVKVANVLIESAKCNHNIQVFDESSHMPFITQETLFMQILGNFLC